jgi:hypothetical protein
MPDEYCPNCVDVGKRTKPPLGVIPRDIFLKKRCDDLGRAITEYYQYDGTFGKVEWVNELNELLIEINKSKS